MSECNDLQLTPLYDKQGQLYGVLISPDLWERIQGPVLDLLGQCRRQDAARPEPLADWEYLKANWDFKYPVDTDVRCDACGATTNDWQADDPRKFWLTAANFTGIVTFHCLACRAKVIKRHFTDKISVETMPFQETKTYRFDAHKGR